MRRRSYGRRRRSFSRGRTRRGPHHSRYYKRVGTRM